MPQNNRSIPENDDFPKIYDNIERSLIDELPSMLRYAEHAAFCVGYFNISEWDHVSREIDNLSGVCRLLIGMHPDGELYSDEAPIEAIANRLIYGSDHEDQRKLNQLARQLDTKKLQIKFHARRRLHAKLYLVQRQRRDDPVMCIVGSSNFTRGGLHSNYELNIDVVDPDVTKKLTDWFEDRWNNSEDISDHLAEIISKNIKGTSIEDASKAAVDYFNELMESDPKNIDAYYMRGKAHLYSKQYGDAIKDFSKVIDLDSEHAYAYCSRGKAYHGSGEYNDAFRDFNKAIDLSPKSAFAYGSRGKAYYDNEQYDNAIKDFDKALGLAPNDPFALDWLEKAERALGDEEKIGEVGEDSDKTQCGSSYYKYYERGKSHLDRGEYDEAIENFSKALELKPNDAFAHCSRGKAYHGKKQYDDAFEDFDNAIESAPKNAFAYGSRGKAYYDSQQYDEAIRDFDKALKLRPNDPFATDWLERAKRALECKEEEGKNSAITDRGVHYNRGIYHLDLKQYNKAILDFNRAIEESPNDAFVYGSRGRAYYYSKQYNKAIEDFEKALKLKQNDRYALNWLERSKRALRDQEGA